MAYSTGTYTTQAGLLSALSTFLQLHGWNEDDAVSGGKFAISKNSMYISFRYDTAVSSGRQFISLHQATGHTPGNSPGLHPGDSGNGYNTSATLPTSNTTLYNERHADVGLAASELKSTYHFFEQDTSPAYCHVVVVREDGQHRHFGFGELVHFGTWTGGEYCYGHYIDHTGHTTLPYEWDDHYVLLDGRFSGSTIKRRGTMRCEAFIDEDAATIWGDIYAAIDNDPGVDEAGNPKMSIQGGYRAGPLFRSLGGFATGRTNGQVNMIPIDLYQFFPQTAPVPDRFRFLGNMADVRGIILDGIEPGAEETIGSETWVCFPSVRKAEVAGNSDYNTKYQGIAYRKETA